LFRGKAQIFAFIDAARGEQPLSGLCRRYGVTRAGFYAWKHRQPNARLTRDAWLLRRIQTVYAASEGTYGSPRIERVLNEAGVTVSRKRVARLMREAGLRARAARVYRRSPGSRAFFLAVPNWARTHRVCRADQLWVADITYLKVLQHWRYLAAVMDRHTRRIVGWSLGRHKTTQLTLRALNRAVANRQPRGGLVFHSDRGVEYAAYEFRTRLAALGIRQSMNRPGEPTDNAHMESFFHSLKSERLEGCAFASDAELHRALRIYIAFYNQRRLHSALNYQTPAAYERAAA
jgi:transposase InsO family protein